MFFGLVAHSSRKNGAIKEKRVMQRLFNLLVPPRAGTGKLS
ncbi:hypothetical protein SAMN05216167_1307 [Spirosoma endophyticum]|uniref:Uncharacterized protein n=1 Tax=Spirosoma endophyticum TaxID=662367 RepID=A0A1I2G762_9BACT|nr:hypothetical protein SAMN05216167_1307 [Spirosoma endophyticum]